MTSTAVALCKQVQVEIYTVTHSCLDCSTLLHCLAAAHLWLLPVCMAPHPSRDPSPCSTPFFRHWEGVLAETKGRHRGQKLHSIVYLGRRGLNVSISATPEALPTATTRTSAPEVQVTSPTSVVAPTGAGAGAAAVVRVGSAKQGWFQKLQWQAPPQADSSVGKCRH